MRHPLALGTVFAGCLTSMPTATAFTHTIPAQPAALTRLQQLGDVLADDLGLGLRLQVGQPVRSNRLDGGTGYGRPDVIVPLADGGLLTLDARRSAEPTSGTRCQLRRFGPALELRWFQQLDMPVPASEGTRAHCLQAAEDGAGNLWLRWGNAALLRLSAEGVLRAQLTPQGDELREVLHLAGDPDGAGVFVSATFGHPQSQLRQHGAARLDGEGRARWQWLDPQTDATYSSVERLATGGLALRGVVTGTQAPTSRLTVLTGAGQLHWRHPHRDGELLQHAFAPDGRVLTYLRPSGLATLGSLTLRAADGQLQGSELRSLEPGTLLKEVKLQAGAGGYLVAEQLVPSGSAQSSPGQTRLQRLDADARSLWVQRRAATEVLAAELRADGSVLWSRTPTFQQVLTSAEILAPVDGTPVAIELRHPAADVPQITASLETDSGGLALVSSGEAPALTWLDPTGRVAWQKRGAGIGLPASGLTPDRLCYSQLDPIEGLGVQCAATASGLELGAPYRFGRDTLALNEVIRADGRRILLVAGSGGGLSIAHLVDAAEPVLRRGLGFPAMLRRFSPSGGLALQQSNAGDPLQRVDGNGQTLFIRSARDLFIRDLYPLDNGETLLRSRLVGGDEFRLLDVGGQQRWTVTTSQAFAGGPLHVLEFEDRLLIGLFDAASYPADLSLTRPDGVFALARADGRVLWRRALPATGGQSTRKRLLVDRERALLMTPQHGALLLEWIDPSSGAILGQRLAAAPPGSTVVDALPEPSTRTLRVATRRQDGTTAADLLIGERLPFEAPATPTLAARGRIGAWYDPASAGQGLLLDLVPGSRTLFGAWFTFDSDPDAAPYSAPSRLRWYSLQGEYAPGSTRVVLQVLENRGGRFAQPPATVAQAIGTAVLEVSGCDQAALEVEFAEPGRGPIHRRIALRALAVRDPACASALPAPAAGGFPAAASGSWFDPESAGQGLLAIVQPQSNNGSGLFFAGWFHYDPAGRADDPGQQAWLTLQGDLADATEGRAEVGIFRTLGSHLAGPSTGNTQRIGSATVQMRGCDRMTLEYRFETAERASPYQGLAGSLSLQKLGGCDG